MCLRQRMGDYIREIVVDEWPEIFGPIAISILEPVQHCLGYDVLLIILIAADPASQGVPALRNKWSRHEAGVHDPKRIPRSEEHTSELQSLMRTSYAVFCLKKKTTKKT